MAFVLRNVAILPAEGPFIPRGFVRINGDTITDLGSGEGAAADQVIDARGRVAIPGLVNAHTHLALTFYRGIADDVRLFDFLAETRKHWGKATPEEAFESALAGCCAAVR